KLQRRLERLQRLQEPDTSSGDARNLLAVCDSSGLRFKNAAEIIAAANEMLEGYYEPFVLEKSPFLRCSRVQSRLSRSRRDAADSLRDEIASTIAAMKPSRPGGRDSLRWIYLNRRYIEQYDEKIGRYTVERIAAELNVSRRTLTRYHDKYIRDFVVAFLDPNRPSGIS
ncbi:MAG: helix-turn-helix domain-containing protein, partial [Chloroflexi bacterium]|nr:helix-turn-helix domain-containing protein [Chloroflexota bacterium]